MPLDTAGLILPHNTVFSFHFAKSKPLDYVSVFPRCSDATEVALLSVTDSRHRFLGAFADEIDGALQAANEYLPYLFGLIEEAKHLPAGSPVPRLNVSWTSSLGYKYTTKYFHSGHWHFEAVNAILMYGLLLRQKARSLHEPCVDSHKDFVDASVNIVKLLCQAAGVFEYIRDIELARWTQKPTDPIPEKYTEYYTILSNLSLAEAEQIVLKKAFLSKTGYKALAKISMDIYEKYRYIGTLLKSPGFVDTYQMMHICSYVSFNQTIYEMFAFKITAYEYLRLGEMGKSLAYFKWGIQRVENCDKIVKDKSPEAARLRHSFDVQLQEMKNMCKATEKENFLVSFEPVPPFSQIEIPTARCLVKPIPWQPPEPRPISITLQEGSSCNIM